MELNGGNVEKKLTLLQHSDFIPQPLDHLLELLAGSHYVLLNGRLDCLFGYKFSSFLTPKSTGFNTNASYVMQNSSHLIQNPSLLNAKSPSRAEQNATCPRSRPARFSTNNQPKFSPNSF